MSEIILPPGISLPPHLQQAEKPAEDATPEEKASSLPVPTGYKLLCVVPDVKETFDNSVLVKAESFMKGEEHGTTVMFVLRMGPDAYKDTAKFPSGPWCQEGDFVIVRTYTGTRVKIYGKEFRLINDDQVDAVVDDPRGISRAAA